MDLEQLRREYETAGLAPADLPADPLAGLRLWVQTAVDQCPAEWVEANAMTVATSDADGHVSARILLLKKILPRGIVFFTNYDSAKAQQLAANPRASAVFHWQYLGRQVRISGTVEKTNREVSAEYFHSRPRGSQIGAAISPQSTVVAESDWPWLDQVDALDKQYHGQQIPLPENWGGYLLIPLEIEFWQGRTNRLHDRIVYVRANEQDSWEIRRLAP